MKVGLKFLSEAFSPGQLAEQSVLAEQAGFDFVEISDHLTWLDAFSLRSPRHLQASSCASAEH